jgi:hypothetical protein
MKRFMIISSLIFQPYIIADTCLDTNKSKMKFKDGKDCDEVKNEIKIPTKREYLAFRVIEKIGSSRGATKNILVDMQGKEIETIRITNQTEIFITINLSDHKTPITLKYADIENRIEQEDGKITLKIPVDKLGNSDKIIIENRRGKVIIKIETSK